MMRYQRSQKTLGPSKRQVHPEMSAIVGRLIVLNVCMLVLGVTSITAQPGQDERCAPYKGKANGLCTAAVSEGCFDGVESQACDDLITNWNERCKVCEGQAPWEKITCLCAADDSASDLYARFLAMEGVEPSIGFCADGAAGTSLDIEDEAEFSFASVHLDATPLRGGECHYRLSNQDGDVVDVFRSGLSPDEVEACRVDIRPVMAQVNCP